MNLTIIKCYWQTIKEWKTFLNCLSNGWFYIAHDYVEQKSYQKGNKIYTPLKCVKCGHISIGWRKF